MITEKKKNMLTQLKDAKEMYVLMSACTKMPFVSCNSETFDDEVFVFLEEENAKAEVLRLREQKQPVQIVKIENKGRLGFFASLYAIGANKIVVEKGAENEMPVLLEELVRKRGPQNESEEKLQTENPELHLTALYFMQELRREKRTELNDDLKELYEEMLAHFQRAKFILAVKADKQIPLLKQKDGKVFQPVFTDIYEFGRFQATNKNDAFQIAVMETKRLQEMLPKEAEGMVINPFGVNVPVQIKRKK